MKRNRNVLGFGLIGVCVLIFGILNHVYADESPVEFVDANLKAAVEDELYQDDPTPTDMLELISLSISSQDILDLTGLEYAENLSTLVLVRNNLASVAPLAGLTSLRVLSVNNNLLTDLSPLSGLTGLESLNVHENRLKDVSPLAGLVNLTTLNIHDNQLRDISALSGLTKLTLLRIKQNQIEDISPLAGMVHLKTLTLEFNQITDISPLANLTQMQVLSIGYNPINDITVLASMQDLRELSLPQCQVVDLSPLCDLQHLQRLWLRDNPLNVAAYEEDLQTIAQHNPGLVLYYDPNPRAPMGLQNCSSGSGEQISLCWDPVPNGPSYTSYYRVYRSSSSDPNRRAIDAWQLDTTYEDAAIHPGKHYHYWVQCAVSDTGESAGAMSNWLDVQTVGTPRLTISSDERGSVTVPGEGVFSYTEPNTVTIVAVPVDPNLYIFNCWTGSAVEAGKVDDAHAAHTTVRVNGDYSLHANFGFNRQQELSVSSEGHGTTTGSGDYLWGSVVAIHASADPHYHFVKWTVSGEVSIANPNMPDTTVTLRGDGAAKAYFMIDSVTLNLLSDVGRAVLTPGEGIFHYHYGREITIKAQAGSGYRFTHWSGNVQSTDNPLTIRCTSNLSLTAHFEPILHSLNINSSAGGAILAPANEVTEYPEGTLVSVAAKITDANVFVFSGWTGSAVQAGCVADPNALVTTVQINDNYTLRAHFFSRLEVIYVDDDANTDPGPCDIDISDPLENGTATRPFDSIQEALEVAPDKAIVRVQVGTYYEHIDFPGRGIHLMGYDPNRPLPEPFPIIDANESGPVVSFCPGGKDPNALLSGFVLTRGVRGVYCENHCLTLSHCLIVGNRTEDPNDGVIEGVDSNMVLLQCTISDNLGTVIKLNHGNLNLVNSILWKTSLDQIVLDEQSTFFQRYNDCSYPVSGAGNLCSDPLFHQVGIWKDLGDGRLCWLGGDYHLQSEFGRWNEVLKQWEVDEKMSPCIGVGDPNVLPEDDPVENVNCGVYGGTPMASKEETL